jgi:hypothetical protein
MKIPERTNGATPPGKVDTDDGRAAKRLTGFLQNVIKLRFELALAPVL